MVEVLFASTVTLTAPLLLAALGGLTSERSGVMNIGLEGKLLVAAWATGFVGAASQNPLLGLLAGICLAVAMSLLHLLLTQTFRIDHIVSGMGINALSIGGTSFASKGLGDRSQSVAGVFFPVWMYWILAAAAVLALALALDRTRGGLRLLAVGHDPDKSRQSGVDVGAVRLRALLATGLLCGLGGALIVTNATSFTDGMTGGRGYIALAALILGGWRPLPTLVACSVFGFVMALQLQLQGSELAGAAVPSQLWGALPYLVTLVALVGFLGKSQPPAGLGRP
ncbi:MAG: ABC transporter permease [Fimbriimonadaceae bacterium]|nr:ABC transporter permease [Fimbriimonadaceae bacterium]QYK58374.1 MAG: ABC transporter permease [Fimbriimonadaceae bacterium]